jgi:hypothetical protein
MLIDWLPIIETQLKALVACRSYADQQMLDHIARSFYEDHMQPSVEATNKPKRPSLTPLIPAMYEAIEGVARVLIDSDLLCEEEVEDFVTLEWPVFQNKEFNLTVQVAVVNHHAEISARVVRKVGTRILTLSAVGRICPACNGLCIVPLHVTDDPFEAQNWRTCFTCLAQVDGKLMSSGIVHMSKADPAWTEQMTADRKNH